MDLLYPIKFTPQSKYRIWGGNSLKTKYGKPFKNDKIGESWEISSVPNSISRVSNGFLKGKGLDELIKTYKSRLVGEYIYKKHNIKFPILVKLIDAKDKLSIQTHPDDKTSKVKHSSTGKTEFWYIMDSKKNSQIVLGFKKGITKKIYKKHVLKGTIDQIVEYKSINSGDSYLINPGQIHAIGKGIILAEIQQTSDVTYRIYDYDRIDVNGKKRELHTDLAEDVIDFENRDNFNLNNKKSNNLVNLKYFKINILNISEELILDLNEIDSFSIFICIEGELKYFEKNNSGTLLRGSSILIPAEINKIILKGEKVKLLHVYM
ncbi:MAG: type I phosphomannose isomerase catalytic subunit [Flavobacteriaceae bacterium]